MIVSNKLELLRGSFTTSKGTFRIIATSLSLDEWLHEETGKIHYISRKDLKKWQERNLKEFTQWNT